MALRFPRRGLVFKYVVVLVALAAAAVVGEGLVQLYFTSHDTRQQVSQLERQQATTVAVAIDQFVSREFAAISAGAGGQMTDAARVAAYGDILNVDQRVVELMYVHGTPRGDEALRVPRNGRIRRVAFERLPEAPLLAAAAAAGETGGIEFLPTPQLLTGRLRALLVARVPKAADDPGTLVAKLNLTQLDDVLSTVVAGGPQFAYYVLDGHGRFIAGSAGAPVPDRPDAYAGLPQVRAAVAAPAAGSGADATEGRMLDGTAVLSSYRQVPAFGGLVFVEEHRAAALAPMRAAAWRTAALLAIFIAVAALIGVLLARRMVRPIRTIQRGAARIGEGALDERVEVHTGDELESLAGEVNGMAARLGESYATLEERVVERTQQLRDALAQLKRVSDHRSRFFAGVSHELRTPLNAILGFSQVLRSRSHGELNDAQGECVDEIHDSGRHLLGVIDDILDLAKIEAGRLELHVEAFDLGECLRGCVGTVREVADRGGVTLGLELAPGLGAVEADERKVRQVVLNLLSNALRFTPPTGTVTVRAERVGTDVRVSVRDSGVGIAPEDQERIFEEFEQAGPDRTALGTGLGLTVSRRLVELHGGRIWLASTPGAGSTFSFTLPQARSAPSPEQPVREESR